MCYYDRVHKETFTGLCKKVCSYEMMHKNIITDLCKGCVIAWNYERVHKKTVSDTV